MSAINQKVKNQLVKYNSLVSQIDSDCRIDQETAASLKLAVQQALLYEHALDLASKKLATKNQATFNQIKTDLLTKAKLKLNLSEITLDI